jgi:hypothetical protein
MQDYSDEMNIEQISDYPFPLYRVKTLFGYELWDGRNAIDEHFSFQGNLINITVNTDKEIKE